MRMQWMWGGAGAMLLCAMPAVASAAPVSAVAQATNPAERVSLVEKVARRCWWEDGRRYCTRVGRRTLYRDRYVEFNIGTRRPEELRTGSSEWWQAMDFEDRGGRGGR
jgi:hypothetical protein